MATMLLSVSPSSWEALGGKDASQKYILTAALFTPNCVQWPFPGLEGRWFSRINTAGAVVAAAG